MSGNIENVEPRDLRLGQLRLIDLSVSIEHDAPGEMMKPKVDYVTHCAGGSEAIMGIFGVRREDLVYSDGCGWAVEDLMIGSHTATHIDAPYHYGTTSEGKPARRIDEVPLEWCFGPGVVLDMRHRKPGEVISISDLEQKLREIKYTLRPNDIVLIHTGAAMRWGTPEYFRQPGLDRESTLWLVGQGVRVIGIDAWTLDREFAAQIADFKRTGDGRYIWPAHFAGITKEYCQIEKLTTRPASTALWFLRFVSACKDQGRQRRLVSRDCPCAAVMEMKKASRASGLYLFLYFGGD